MFEEFPITRLLELPLPLIAAAVVFVATGVWYRISEMRFRDLYKEKTGLSLGLRSWLTRDRIPEVETIMESAARDGRPGLSERDKQDLERARRNVNIAYWASIASLAVTLLGAVLFMR